MATAVIMPKVDMVMETGTFIEWLKQEGDTVVQDEPVAMGTGVYNIRRAEHLDGGQ